MKGKALLVITRLDSEYVRYDVRSYVQSCVPAPEIGCDGVAEEFQLLETDSLPLPNAAYKLRVGQSVTVSVVYEFDYHQDYEGEWDVELIYHKQRVLNRTRCRPRYVAKADR